MIRRTLLACCGALLLTACDRDGAATGEVASESAPPLWEIVGADGAVEGWLFGTVHALPDGIEWRTDLLDSTLGEADTLVVEVASLEDGAALNRLFSRMATDEPSPPLAERVDPKLREAYEQLLVRANLRRDQFDGLESWAAALSLAQLAQTAKTANGVDRELISRFGEREVVELEGAAAQLEIFDRLPEPEQRDLLNAVLKETRDREIQAETLAEVWRSGDIERLAALSMRGMLSDPELYEALLAGRNRAWAAQIENLLSAEERPLVAVGAGHVVGPDGLPAMLHARGYILRRVQ
ncbi:MAG: TraB/GumN family protein [Qipengyuania sp.]